MKPQDLTVEDAAKILEHTDLNSVLPFSRRERAAIVRIGAAYLTGEITKLRAAELLRVSPDVVAKYLEPS